MIEAELPGVKKEELDLGIEGDNISITVNRSEEVNKDEKITFTENVAPLR